MGFTARRDRSRKRLSPSQASDSLPVRLAAVNEGALWPVMTLQGLAGEAFGGQKIAMLAEEELNRVADAVDGAVEIHPSAANLLICLIELPLVGDGALSPIEAFKQQG